MRSQEGTVLEITAIEGRAFQVCPRKVAFAEVLLTEVSRAHLSVKKAHMVEVQCFFETLRLTASLPPDERVIELRPTHVGSLECRSRNVGPREVDTREVCTAKISEGEVAAEGICSFQIRTNVRGTVDCVPTIFVMVNGEPGEGDFRPSHVESVHLREQGSREVAALENRTLELYPSEVGPPVDRT